MKGSLQKLQPGDPRHKVIFALDVSSLPEARRFVALLKDHTKMFKVGLELYSAFGPAAVQAVLEEGGGVFLDLKLHDIPHTVSRAAEEAVRLGVEMFNVHATGGREMMREAVARTHELAAKLNRPSPLILAVTILTSLNEDDLQEIGLRPPVEERVVKLAELARSAGVDGVVASPREIRSIRQRCGPGFRIVTPGIRPAFVRNLEDDQKRVMTAGEALAAGADYLVIGRPIRLAPDPAAAMGKVLQEIQSSWKNESGQQ